MRHWLDKYSAILCDLDGCLISGNRLLAGAHEFVSSGEDEMPVAETGALFQAVQACLPDVAFRAIGKPNPPLYKAGLNRLGSKPGQFIAIGDNPETDLVGARKMGIPCIVLGNSERSLGPKTLAALIKFKETSFL